MGVLSSWWDAVRDFFSGVSSMSELGVPGSRLYVGNLSYKVKEDELRALFQKHGRVKSLHLIRDRITRRLKGYAFLEMVPADAQKALALNGVDFLGRKLVVSIAKSKQPREQQQPSSAPRQHSAPRSGGRQKESSSSGGQSWRRRRRSGPRAYGDQGQKDSNTPLPRYE